MSTADTLLHKGDGVTIDHQKTARWPTPSPV